MDRHGRFGAPRRGFRAGRRAWPPAGPLAGSLAALLTALLAALPATLPGSPARAQTLLYPDRLPDDHAYVRFVNTLAEPVTVRPVGFGEPVTLGIEGAARVSAYRVVEGVAGRQLEAEVSAGGREGRGGIGVEPGSFETVLIEPGPKLAAVKDEAELSQTRARLAFYNAAPGCAAAGLQLDPGGRTVFAGVAPATMRGRAVNPSAEVRLRATCAPGQAAPLDVGEIGAGGQYSLWLMAPAGKAIAFMSVNAIAPYLR